MNSLLPTPLLWAPLRQWRALLGILALSGLTSAVTALQPWPMKILVDYALSHASLPEWLHSLITSLSLTPTPALLIFIAAAAALGLHCLNASLDVSLTWLWSAVGQRMVYDLAVRLFARLQRLSLLFHHQRTVGDSLSRLMEDTYSIYTLTNSLLVAPGQYLLILISVSFVAWNLDPSLTLLSLTAAPLMAVSARFFGAKLKRRMSHSRQAQSRLASFVHQTLTAIPVVQAFATEERNCQQFQQLATESVSLSQRRVLMESAYGLVNGSVTSLGTALVLYAGGLEVLSDNLSLGSLLVFLAYLQSLQTAFKGLLTAYGSLKSNEAKVERVVEIFQAVEEVPEAAGAIPLPLPVRGQICLERVTFGYQADCPTLIDVSLEAQPGETVALVGATGAGKSTLVSLIPRFFDPWQGRILLDGTDVRQVQLQSLREQISLMLQEPFLLPLTVRDNIAYSRPQAKQEEVVAAAIAANADEFIQRLPQGYDTVLGERGSTLSGGQKQRLAIARALLKDAPILILDEPTSALDAQTEALLLEALERLRFGRTAFIIAHRLSTIQQADRIAVLERGRLIEMGTHQELLTQGGTYYRLHSLQQQGNREEVLASTTHH